MTNWEASLQTGRKQPSPYPQRQVQPRTDDDVKTEIRPPGTTFKSIYRNTVRT